MSANPSVATPNERARREAVPPERGLWSWLTTVDHKRIGMMYIGTSLLFLIAGGVEAVIIRLQLARPDNHLVSAYLYNQLFTMHGITMIFLVIMPMMTGFINLVVPIQIGARDVAFPRLNALSLWLFMGAGVMLYAGWFLGGTPDSGWFNYVPISELAYNPGLGIDWYDLGIQISGVSTLLTGINFLTTILNLRAPGMSFLRLPMFVWTTLVFTLLIVFAFPPLTVDLFLQTFDRLFGAQFFTVSSGGAPLLWANLFWVFGHPEVYIMMMPGFGIISEIVPVMSKKPLFGYSAMVLSSMAIGFLSFMVWVHHMFDLGFGPWVNAIFALTSMLIAVPTGVKVFNWLATMWGGQVQLNTAMLWVFGFLVTFVIGGMSGVMLALAPADLQFNNSYFVVAHFHYVLVGGSLFTLFAATYYWFPKFTGRLLDERLGRWHFWLVFLGFNVTFFPMHLLGLMGMPRRIYTYAPHLGLTFWNQVSTAGILLLTAGLVAFYVNLIASWVHGQKAAQDPWDGRTLEWALPAPVPAYNFAYIPQVRGRDPWWVEKRAGQATLLAAPAAEAESAHGIHLPAPTPLPLYLALAIEVAAFGLVYRSHWVAPAGFFLVAILLHRSMFTKDPGRVVYPEAATATEVGTAPLA
ncbi:MAG: cytochrome c oxidase subunit I [Firmicutes bacterium]|nr:cytochrome c oxidase subunit I [Alicyclobacillaceae bacterium]MCL6496063.1 cytochrome c oxidase subunit I [Bacillota bacterium]